MFHGRDPFTTEIEPNAEKAEELAELKVSNAMKPAFNNKTDDSSFWLSLYDSYPLLSKKASVMFVQFTTRLPAFVKLDLLIWRP